MTESTIQYAVKGVHDRIFTMRGQKVILDADLARIYGVATKVLNQSVKRNTEKFPEDFAFQLTPREIRDMWSQSVTTSQRFRSPKYRPNVFTEHGAIMAATVLNSSQAVEMSVFVVRAFVKMREQLLATATLAKRLAEVEKALLIHDSDLRDLYQKIRPLLLPPPDPDTKPIGFSVKERRASYRAPGKPHS
jgi:hypothetical protein